MMRGSLWADDVKAPSTSGVSLPSRRSVNNVFHLLAHREVAPRTKHSSRGPWGDACRSDTGASGPRFKAEIDSRQSLISWTEAESLQHLSAKYCPLTPPPRSTIAASFSPDGKTLASTHGDHTVKIIDCQTGKCLKVLSGHRRTPWVVRFHPLQPEVLASGSLDQEVRLWNANTAECIESREFYRPIASIAFHALGQLLAVASGHKLYIWHYNNRREDKTPPASILRTRRTLRAVHFHPLGAPFLLTAEVNDIDSSDSAMTHATSLGYLRYPPPTVYVAHSHSDDHPSLADGVPLMSLPLLVWPSFSREDAGLTLHRSEGSSSSNSAHQRVDAFASVRLMTYSTPSGQYELLLSPIAPNNSSTVPENEAENTAETSVDAESAEPQPIYSSDQDPTYWEVPFLQGWLAGHQASQNASRHAKSTGYDNSFVSVERATRVSSSATPMKVAQSESKAIRRSNGRHRSSHSRLSSANGSGELSALNDARDESYILEVVRRHQTELASSLASAASAELPCTVKLRIWTHDINNPCAPLDADKCRLTIPYAVLCSEMGAHFSPCGRYLAACVACILPHLEADPYFPSQVNHEATAAATSPTRHPISARQVLYELRIYSLEKATFGLVLSSRAIRAAHCLTSIQFSPTSKHLLLAYGRRHSSLLKSVVIDGEMTVPVYTILEVYRVSDMELVRVLPSADDEVNVACFHPSVGGGLVYGTKEGKLRILHCDDSYGINHSTTSFPEKSMLELQQVPTFAPEC